MKRFEDYVAQNRLKQSVLGVLSPMRREIHRAHAEESRLMSASADELHAVREARFRRLLAVARGAPYWRKIIDGFGKSPEAFTLDDVRDFPFLTKDILREREHELRVPGARGVYENFSGGSTGAPIRFHQDRTYKVHMSVSTRICNEMAGAFPGARMAKLWGAPQDRRQIEGPLGRLKLWLLNHRYFDTFDMGEERMLAYHEAMKRFQPDLIQAYASSIHLFARFLAARGIRPDYPRVSIISAAERLFPHQRAEIESVFPVRVFNRYGSREVSAMAAECGEHDGMHVTAASHLVETVCPSSLEPVSGTPGEIVITVLHNHAMPFIRYRIGDMGTLVDGPCRCGRTAPRLAEVHGRTSDNFLMPGGRIVHGEYFTHMFYGRAGVKQFQFVQESLGEFTLRIVPAAGYRADLERQFEAEVREMIGPRARFRIELCGEIPVTASGKFRFTVSKVGPGGVLAGR
jgi:phenylacetate-CoA ligase